MIVCKQAGHVTQHVLTVKPDQEYLLKVTFVPVLSPADHLPFSINESACEKCYLFKVMCFAGDW